MQLDVNQYPYIDLSKMFDIPGCAVRLPTEYDAETVIANFIRQYPNESGYHLSATYWDNHQEDTAYSLWDNFDDDVMKLSTLGYADVPWFKEKGYKVIEFEDLAPMPELEASDMPLEFLIK